MKFVSLVSLTALSSFSFVAAQIPSCAYSCLGQFQQDAASTGCGAYVAANYPCFCAHRNNFGNSINCVNTACSGGDAQAAISVMLGRC
ncbi:uncharacterized protein SAPINGB_P006230 [Magnusiomyces paraingens]|uniref:CFEM domain-containing protein n=1 Tax=Magnusiomyces paraingens TaxID=2606893 RepID=A0A5E8C5V7_9ASCO|nr:uncharacterized protein SAPINGB_P006230 [Saprochaete ingens]VVT58480.1 unnamed protein product [Saprochaete ingens]